MLLPFLVIAITVDSAKVLSNHNPIEHHDREDLLLSYGGASNTEQLGAYRTCSRPGRVLLTMDDGPSANMGELLDIWDREGVPGIFFIIGKHLAKEDNPHWLRNRKLLLKAYRMGYEIGSHGFTHTSLVHLTDEQIIKEMNDTAALIYQAIGKYPVFMRPPEGDLDERVMRILSHTLGYTVVRWNRDLNDWQYSETIPDHAVKYVERWFRREDRRRKSFVVLAHDRILNTVRSQPRVVRTIRSRGYLLVTARKCFGLSSSYRNYLYYRI